MTLETLDLVEDDYLKLCFNETLRIEPTIPVNSSVCVTQDLDICGFKIKAGEMIFMNVYHLHHNVD